jgi:outer membrane protein insertion porin family
MVIRTGVAGLALALAGALAGPAPARAQEPAPAPAQEPAHPQEPPPAPSREPEHPQEPSPSPPPPAEGQPGATPPSEPAPPPATEPGTPPKTEPGTPPGAEPDNSGTPAPADQAAAPATIGQIVVDGNLRVSDSTFFNNLHIRRGDAYDERVIRQEFRRLWDLGLFDDLSVEARRRAGNTVDLIFHVRDRPLVGKVSFVGQKAVTETSIQERLQEGKAEVRRGQPVDFTVLKHAEALVTHMLGEKGYLDARTRAKLGPVTQGQQDVTFEIHEGGKTKIKQIDFTGNTVYTDHQLRKVLKLTKQANWLTSWASQKPLYHPAKFDQDAENIRTAYKSRGYLDIAIQPEVVEIETKGTHPPKGAPKGAAEPPRRETFDPLSEPLAEDEPETEAAPAPPPEGETDKQRQKRLEKEQKERAKKEKEQKKKRWVYLTVPLVEGPSYRLGTMEVDGNSVFSDREILARFPLRPGMVYNDTIVKLATKRIEDDYGERGYFYVSIDPQLNKHDAVADLRLEVTEDRKYYVDRIEFAGNTSTRDGVLRREMRLQEQSLFNVKQMRLGLRKIAQLGYWQVGGDPEVKPDPDSGKVRLEVNGTESSRNEIQVGGGVSGLDGGFFQGSYSTRNFLGRGEVLSAFLQTGRRGSRYALNFTEPWFLGHPWSLGFSLFRRATTYTGFRREGQGGAVNFGRLLGNFSRFDVIYGLEDITFVPTSLVYGTQTTTSTTSSVNGIYTFDTRNNFFRPTRGYRMQSSLEYAGGFLGGDNDFYKYRQDATIYFRGFAKRHYAAFNASYGYIKAYGNSLDVPPYERFYLGGERSLRLFPIRSVGPVRRDEDLNHNGFIDRPEDRNPDGIFEPCEDLNGNGKQDPNEKDRGNCRLDPGEDVNGNFILDTEDLNHNGRLDPGEDLNGNGVLDTEDTNNNGVLDPSEDRPDGFFTPYCPADDKNMNGVKDAGETDQGNCKLDAGEDTNGDGVYGTVYPGGVQYLQFNAEYSIPLTDTVEFALFYDAGNAYDNGEAIDISNMRVDYGLEMRFFLPIFQAPLRLIYGFIQNPLPGEDTSNFIFSIGTTF